MKKKFATMFVAAATMFVMAITMFSGVTYAGVNDFYFSDFTADYYLTKDAEGVSHLKVVESVTAEFPEFNQNKGICRYIPFTNQNGRNITLPHLSRSDIKVTRGGVPEPIYSIEKEQDFYNVCTGTDDYVLGSQTYVFEYEFEKVVTEFDKGGRVYQELYWDTNGNGATQRFDKVIAKVHFEDGDVWTGDSWCYVGLFKKSGQERCTTTKIEDGVKFETVGLKGGENLTFDVELKAGSFVMPEPEDNYAYVWITVVLGIICVLGIGWKLRKYLSTREKERYYKGLFVKPEYQPNKDYSLPEMAELYIGKKKDAKVAMLLEMVVKHKIEFQKREKRKWQINVKSLDGVGEEYVDLLSILNHGPRPAEGDVIKIESHAATNRLITLKKSLESKVVGDLKRDKLVENKYNFGSSHSNGWSIVFAMSMIFVPVALMVGVFVLSLLEGVLGLDGAYGGELIFEEHFYKVAFVMITVTVVLMSWLSERTSRYEHHTMKGLEMSRYMDGLKEYIEMAEAERMKMLQSVEGADTSAEGIVKLYEKLLPYAAVFGLEESWMNEMKDYCKVEEIEEPDYLMAGYAVSDITRSLQRAASVATASTVMSSSGGGSSSGFSGGGGGGFSGGGGGGGGFGGR
ncbi:DUF2207 domain-containing protein [Candidatus Saccharibacteria bacterium]|nr:DUF2207 domain-containing protein [Candidatus Saccharibacteria bacterium]